MPNRLRFRRIIDGVSSIKWLLRDEFSTPRPASIDGTPANPGPGGNRTVVDTGKYLSINNGILSGNGITGGGDPKLIWPSFARVIGRTLFGSVNGIAGRIIFGWTGNANPTATPAYGFHDPSGTLSLCPRLDGFLVNNTVYSVAFPLRTSGAFCLVKGGTYSEWCMEWVDTSQITTPLYPGTWARTGSGWNGTIDNVRVTDLPAPWNTDYGVATQRVSGVVPNNTNFTHTANSLIEFTITTLPSSNDARVNFRVQDANNRWFILFRSDGVLQLWERVSGVNNLRGSGSTSNGARIVIHTNGSAIKIFNNTALSINYALGSNFSTMTSGYYSTDENPGADAVVSNLISWPFNITGSALTALTDALAGTPSPLLLDNFDDSHAIPWRVNAGLADPGGTGGSTFITRKLNDPSNYSGIIGGKQVDTGGAASWANPALWYGSITRAPGMMIFSKWKGTISSTSGMMFGFSANNSAIASVGNTMYVTTNRIQLYGHTTNPILTYITLASDTVYHWMVLLRSSGAFYFIKGGPYANWVLAYVISEVNAATLYPCKINYNLISETDFIRIPEEKWLPTPLASDSFNRADGAIGSTDGAGHLEANGGAGLPWYGSSNVIISGNKVVATPALGAEVLPDPGMEGVYTGGLCAGYQSQLGPTVAEDNTNMRNGLKCQSVASTTVNAGVFQTQTNISLLSNTWYELGGWYKKISGANSNMLPVYPSSGFASNNGQQIGGITSATYQNLKMVNRCVNGSSFKIMWTWSAGGAASDTIVFDDISIKPIAISEMISCVQSGAKNYFASVGVTISTSAPYCGFVPQGMVLNLDSTSNPQNFLLAYVILTSGSNYRFYLDKCLNGSYSNIISATFTYSAGANIVVIKDGTSVSVYYNNAQLGSTQTISDTEIINNTINGLFVGGSYSTAGLDNFVVWNRGSEGQYSSLDKFIRE